MVRIRVEENREECRTCYFWIWEASFCAYKSGYTERPCKDKITDLFWDNKQDKPVDACPYAPGIYCAEIGVS